MKTEQDLRKSLLSLHKKSYPAYKSLQGSYLFSPYTFVIDHVQGDPFASPSKLHLFLPHDAAGFPAEYYKTEHRKTALEDFLLRVFGKELEKYNFKANGSGKSGLLSTSRPGQEMISRTACEISAEGITIRLEAGFPAAGRTIQAYDLEKMLFDYLPRAAEASMRYKHHSAQALLKRIHLSDDQAYIREWLFDQKMTAFIADGSVLPRVSGVSQRPMKNCIPFESPASLRIQLSLPHKGPLAGLAIPHGITLIVGGGYHGKSTLLNALETGVYNHIEGDGREYVICDNTAIKLRAEDGRSITDDDISLFINDLPNGKDTTSFSTPDASGSTSQAANVVEGIEAGSRLFLIDEDTSATNFMVRDEFMQQVIAREKEPITPFLERVRDLYEKSQISTILVAGSSGAYFHAADLILQMDSYRPIDITDSVKKMCSTRPCPSLHAPGYRLPDTRRMPLKTARYSDSDRVKTKTRGKDSLQIGKIELDLRAVEQLIDPEQTQTLSGILKYLLESKTASQKDIVECVNLAESLIKAKGLGFFCGNGYVHNGLASPRRQEIFAAVNRFRVPQ